MTNTILYDVVFFVTFLHVQSVFGIVGNEPEDYYISQNSTQNGTNVTSTTTNQISNSKSQVNITNTTHESQYDINERLKAMLSPTNQTDPYVVFIVLLSMLLGAAISGYVLWVHHRWLQQYKLHRMSKLSSKR